MDRDRIYCLIEKSHFDFIVYFVFSLVIVSLFWEFSFIKITGIVISFSGFMVWIFSLFQLGGSFQIRTRARGLVTSGIYSWIRHPIYFGGFLVILGGILYTINLRINIFLVLYLVFFLVVQIYRVKNEEKTLEKKFGKKYIDYKKKTLF